MDANRQPDGRSRIVDGAGEEKRDKDAAARIEGAYVRHESQHPRHRLHDCHRATSGARTGRQPETSSRDGRMG